MPNIKTTLGECFVFAGASLTIYTITVLGSSRFPCDLSDVSTSSAEIFHALCAVVTYRAQLTLPCLSHVTLSVITVCCNSHINPYPADHDYCRFQSVLLVNKTVK